MHVQSGVAHRGTFRLPGVQAHADTYRYTFGPGVGGKATLGRYRRRDGIGSASKGGEEAVPLYINFVAIPLL
jgi:hypothetical protein